MSNIEFSISMPLDEEGYFRRECPLCMKEFKVLLTKEEITDVTQSGLSSFMLAKREETDDNEIKTDDGTSENHCPYCGQAAAKRSWWTQEQLNYLNVYAHNVMAKLVNENLLKPLNRNFGSGSGFITMQVKTKEIEQKEPWISNEVNDMQAFDLPCCQRKIKIDDTARKVVYCFFCGFPHKCV